MKLKMLVLMLVIIISTFLFTKLHWPGDSKETFGLRGKFCTGLKGACIGYAFFRLKQIKYRVKIVPNLENLQLV